MRREARESRLPLNFPVCGELMNLLLGRNRTRAWSVALVLILSVVACAAQSLAPVIEVPNPPNAAAHLSKPYVVLVSLDGFRYDYTERYGAKNLLDMALRGVSAPNGMIPSYPSVTFPNHYTIVTGLYPEHHGIVANNFYDPERKEKYSFSDPKTNADGSWYGGTPLWVLAEQQGMRSACLFWPGSEAEIQGKRPSYYLHFDDKFPDEQRVQQILAWLRLPAKERPHFITLYYSNVDLARLGLSVDLIVVADHGMEAAQGGWIALDKWADLSQFETSGPLLYAKSEADAEMAYNSLLGATDSFEVYRRAKMPESLHFDSNPRVGDPVVVPTGPFSIVAHVPSNLMMPPQGAHGYDPDTMPSMKAIFYAAGPEIRAGLTVAPFENIHLYPLIAKILGLQIGPVDGQLRVLEGVLKKPSPHRRRRARK